MALDTAFMRKDLQVYCSLCWGWVVSEAIGRVEVQATVDADDLSNNHKTEDIKRALTVLESVEKLNQLCTNWPAICAYAEPAQSAYTNLSWILKGGCIMDKKEGTTSGTSTSFWTSQFGPKRRSLELQLVPATHELVQRLSSF